jgi:hypothetical protein
MTRKMDDSRLRLSDPLSRKRRALLADVGHQRHEARPLDGVLDSALEGGAIAAAFAAKQLALGSAKFFESLHVFIIHEGRPRTSFFGAKPATILPAPSELLANHVCLRPLISVKTAIQTDGSITLAMDHPSVNLTQRRPSFLSAADGSAYCASALSRISGMSPFGFRAEAEGKVDSEGVTLCRAWTAATMPRPMQETAKAGAIR